MSSPREVVAAQARTASDLSAVQRIAADRFVNLALDVSAVAGTSPTLDVKVQWSMDGTTWTEPETADAFAQVTAAAQVIRQFDLKAPWYRIVWTIGGTAPSFTFSVHEFVT